MSTGAEDGRAEDELIAAFHAGRFEHVTTLAIERYGGEVLGFLSARLKSPSDASEVFSMFCEDLWKGMSSFRWQCSLRGYCYTLARNAANRFSVSPPNRADRHSPLSHQPQLCEVIERTRSRTAAYLRTEAKSRMRILREQLPEEEQTLLILRVDRDLSWDELAVIMGEASSDVPEELRRASARLRKRFQSAKDTLRELARQDGLIRE